MSTALYRRYRPESFADVIGQEHVTEPLMAALRSGRVNHAYLFSGPRGCGKTTSARILARCLNCEQGPTPDPCGTCDSCLALARDGAGSVDVIEIDAASHGGVEDARDLRERAAFGPAQARYKIYIIDEAHMVTPHGFNALLKVVEEPPPHVKFIFATTEPDKVLATIRSRTHHYPFHLVPPQKLTAYLEQLCAQEGVELEKGVLSFVTRAGGGSVRDSLSVLDQLISGSDDEGLTYERTASLLGFTDVELLDAVVDAVAAGDAATVFGQIDKVMESGHDPRRFVEDLLERYRDLIVLTAIGQEPASGLLPGLPEDQIERMRHQAAAQGPESLSRLADLVSNGLSEMSGAVSYRLILELLAARLLLPAASGEEGYGARLDRLERRLGAAPGGGEPSPARDAAGPSRPARTESGPDAVRPAPAAERQAPERQAAEPRVPEPRVPGPQAVRTQAEPVSAPGQDASAGESSQGETPAPAPGVLDTAALRRLWSDVLQRVKSINQRSWSGLQPVTVLDFDGERLLLGMPDEKWMNFFMGGPYAEALRQALIEEIALETRIEATVASDYAARRAEPPLAEPPLAEPPSSDDDGPSADEQQAPPPLTPRSDRAPSGRVRTRAGYQQVGPPRPVEPTPAPSQPARRTPEPDPADARPAQEPSMAEQLGAGVSSSGADTPDWSQQARTTTAPAWAAGGDDVQPPPARTPRTRAAAVPPVAETPSPARRDEGGDAPSDDDEDLATSGQVGQPVIESVLGGTVIAINDEPVA